jgi:hypothetical protein
MLRLTLALLAVSGVWAAPPDTIFPSDSKKPPQSSGTELLEAECAGILSGGMGSECKSGCSDQSYFGTLEAVTLGHFLSPASEDAALWMTGCESRSANFGGTILLARSAGRWTMLWYKPGVVTSLCHKVTVRSKREILVCIGSAGGRA